VDEYICQLTGWPVPMACMFALLNSRELFRSPFRLASRSKRMQSERESWSDAGCVRMRRDAIRRSSGSMFRLSVHPAELELSELQLAALPTDPLIRYGANKLKQVRPRPISAGGRAATAKPNAFDWDKAVAEARAINVDHGMVRSPSPPGWRVRG
jgi:hypothetical protein